MHIFIYKYRENTFIFTIDQSIIYIKLNTRSGCLPL